MNLTISPIKSNLSRTLPISFKGYDIIDGHTHIGGNCNAEDLLSLTKDRHPYDWKSDDVKFFVTSAIENMTKKDGKYLMDEIEGNKKIIENIRKTSNPEKFIPLAVCEVDTGNAKNIDKLLSSKDDKFYGLKFHPMVIEIDADDERYNPYMKVAQKHKVPCVFHTENGYADPKKIYELAKRTPDVPVVLYHMNIVPSGKVGDRPEEEINSKGLQNDKDKWCWDVREAWNREGVDVVEQAIKNKDANLYLETSWTKPEFVVEAIKRVGADRVIWGTDAPIGDNGENSNREKYIDHVNEFKKAIREAFPENAEEIEDKVFYKNAEKLFGKNKQQNPIMQFANKVENGAKQLYTNYINSKAENIKTLQKSDNLNANFALLA